MGSRIFVQTINLNPISHLHFDCPFVDAVMEEGAKTKNFSPLKAVQISLSDKYNRFSNNNIHSLILEKKILLKAHVQVTMTRMSKVKLKRKSCLAVSASPFPTKGIGN